MDYRHRDGQEHRISADAREWSFAAEKALKIEMQYRESLDLKPPHSSSVEMAVKLHLGDRMAQHLRDLTISKLTTIFQ